MADKDFKVKNKLVLNGLAQAGILLADANKQVDSVTYLTPLQGGTGTTTAPAAGQVLYSTSGTTYAPVTLSTLVPQEVYYQASAPSSPTAGAIWVESDVDIPSFQLPTQTGNSGKYLTTDGSNTSWGTVDLTSYATKTGSETLTNKTISGSSNTLSNIGNSSLTNSSITINGSSVSLGGTVTITSGLSAARVYFAKG